MVDDHQLFLAGLRLLFEANSGFEIVGQASNRSEALVTVRQQQPDVILLDLDLGNDSGIDLLPDLMEACSSAHIVIVTALADPQLHLRAVRLGAKGVVHKTDAPELLLKAIHKVCAGEAWLNKSMVSSVVAELHRHSANLLDPDTKKINTLTARELEIVALIGEGRRNKQIGERLFISEKTVRHYLTSIYDKLEVKDRLELMLYAYQHGLAEVNVFKKAAAKFRSVV